MNLRDNPDAFANSGRSYSGDGNDPPPPGKSNGKGIDQHQTDWRLLLRTRKGVVVPSTANIAIELEHDPVWEGVFSYDEFEQQLLLLKHMSRRFGDSSPESFPRPWRDSDTTDVLLWFQLGDYPTIGIEKVDLAIREVAERKYRFHPVRQYLDSLEWDRNPRLDGWLERYVKAQIKDASHQVYVRQIGAKFLIAAVARIYQPGCQADHVPVLEGLRAVARHRS